MKKRVKRLLAMLLSLTMVLSLLPSTALASAMLASAGGRAGDVVPDGATSDNWVQIEGS